MQAQQRNVSFPSSLQISVFLTFSSLSWLEKSKGPVIAGGPTGIAESPKTLTSNVGIEMNGYCKVDTEKYINVTNSINDRGRIFTAYYESPILFWNMTIIKKPVNILLTQMPPLSLL